MLFVKKNTSILHFIRLLYLVFYNPLHDICNMSEFEVDKNYIINHLQKEDDSKLIELIQKEKDFNAYIALFIKYSTFLKSIIWKIIRNTENVNDIYQELYLKAVKWKKFYKLKSVGIFIEMAKNVSFTFYNKQKKQKKLSNNDFVLKSLIYVEDTENYDHAGAMNCELIHEIVDGLFIKFSNGYKFNCTQSELEILKESLTNLTNNDLEMIRHIFEAIVTKLENFNNGNSKIVNEILICFLKRGLNDFRSYCDKYINFKNYNELISLYYIDSNTSVVTLRQKHCRMNKELRKIVSKFNGVFDET